jgi:hypothetical protein
VPDLVSHFEEKIGFSERGGGKIFFLKIAKMYYLSIKNADINIFLMSLNSGEPKNIFEPNFIQWWQP